jgi:hypothetical protein
MRSFHCEELGGPPCVPPLLEARMRLVGASGSGGAVGASALSVLLLPPELIVIKRMTTHRLTRPPKCIGSTCKTEVEALNCISHSKMFCLL